MKLHYVNRLSTKCFSDLANALVYDQEKFAELIQNPFSLEAFKTQMMLKEGFFTVEKRALLVRQLKTDYSEVEVSDAVLHNIEKLNSTNTYTVTTGHQLSLFTGPLYFVIKIYHVIELCKKLKEKYPENHFVPVFWMASEDHDYEEIKSFQLFNKKITWDTSQTGTVGRMKLENWDSWKIELKELFQNHQNSEVLLAIDAYQGSDKSEATFRLVHHLFGSEGLVVLDADRPAYKKELKNVFLSELQEQKVEKLVEGSTRKLELLGYHGQAHARSINFFYLGKGDRQRLIKEEGIITAGSSKFLTSQECIEEFDRAPENFSPNVILRPLYQEMILPNLCYVGGGGEIAYWLQLKDVFDCFSTPFPLIQVRNSMLLLDSSSMKKMETVGWNTEDVFKDIEVLKKEFILKNTSDFDFSSVRNAQSQLEKSVEEIITKVDGTLEVFGKAEMARFQKQLDVMEQKLLRSEKAKHEKALLSMDQIKERLFFGGMQERSLNFFHFCGDGQVFSNLEKLRKAIQPLEKDLIVLEW